MGEVCSRRARTGLALFMSQVFVVGCRTEGRCGAVVAISHWVCRTDEGITVTTADTSSSWLRRYRPATAAATRLICFPHAGGAASFYRPIAMEFAPAADVLAIQYPGRQDRHREPCVTDIATLADLVADELACLDDGLPAVFFGHSMGAVLAFEVAWRLEQNSTNPPSTVIASGRRGPATTRNETVHLRGDDDIVEELRALSGTDAMLLADEEILRMSMPAVRGDYTAIETYAGARQRQIRANITVLTGDADPKTTVDEAQTWEQHTTGTFRMTVLPGGHFFLVEHQQAVLREIAADLHPA